MEYCALGTDLAKIDLQYLSSLTGSFLLDLQTLASKGPSAYTSAIAGLLNDKQTLQSDALAKYQTLSTETASAAVIAANQSLLQTIQANLSEQAPLIQTISTWSPVAGPAVSFPAYRKGVPFTSAPATGNANMALAQTADVLTKLNAPLAVLVNQTPEQAQAAMTGTSAPGKIPTVALIGGLAAAAYFMTR